MKRYREHIIRFIVLVLIQVLILNQIELNGYINPFLYILFILRLPPSMGREYVMLLAFVLGFCIDVFSNSMGLHMGASVFLAYMRPYLINIVTIRGGVDYETLNIKQLKLGRFVTYAGLAALTHHFFLFYMDVFKFSQFFHTFLRATVSSIFTLILLLIAEYLTIGKRR